MASAAAATTGSSSGDVDVGRALRVSAVDKEALRVAKTMVTTVQGVKPRHDRQQWFILQLNTYEGYQLTPEWQSKIDAVRVRGYIPVISLTRRDGLSPADVDTYRLRTEELIMPPGEEDTVAEINRQIKLVLRVNKDTIIVGGEYCSRTIPLIDLATADVFEKRIANTTTLSKHYQDWIALIVRTLTMFPDGLGLLRHEGFLIMKNEVPLAWIQGWCTIPIKKGHINVIRLEQLILDMKTHTNIIDPLPFNPTLKQTH